MMQNENFHGGVESPMKGRSSLLPNAQLEVAKVGNYSN